VSHSRPIENIPGSILEFALQRKARLDHSFDEAVDVFAPISQLSSIGRCSPGASFEAASWRMKSESWFHSGKPQIFYPDLSSDD